MLGPLSVIPTDCFLIQMLQVVTRMVHAGYFGITERVVPTIMHNLQRSYLPDNDDTPGNYWWSWLNMENYINPGLSKEKCMVFLKPGLLLAVCIPGQCSHDF